MVVVVDPINRNRNRGPTLNLKPTLCRDATGPGQPIAGVAPLYRAYLMRSTRRLRVRKRSELTRVRSNVELDH